MTGTDWFIIGILLLILVYDVWKVCDGRKNNTISHRIVHHCRSKPWLALVILIFTILLAGHFFMPYHLNWIWPQPIFLD